MIRVKVKSEKVEKALDRLAREAADFAPALKEIGEMLVVSTRQRFDDEQAPDMSELIRRGKAVTGGRLSTISATSPKQIRARRLISRVVAALLGSMVWSQDLIKAPRYRPVAFDATAGDPALKESLARFSAANAGDRPLSASSLRRLRRL